MENEDFTYRTFSPVVKNLITTILLLFTAIGYFFGVQIPVLVFTGICSLFLTFQDNFSIIVYEDRFVFRYSNYLGKLMAIDNIFYYSDVKEFNYSTERWRADFKESAVIFLAKLFLPTQGGHYSKDPEANVVIRRINDFKEPETLEFSFLFSSGTFIKALELIDEKCKENNKTKKSN